MNSMDRLAMLFFGGDEKSKDTIAKGFIHDVAARPLGQIQYLNGELKRRIRHGFRLFIPPKEHDRVIMFADNSGAYIHSDGFVTPMGEDISHEVHAWEEVLGQ